MEYWVLDGNTKVTNVLILIIMEDTHGVIPKEEKATVKAVLILIIMEDTHGDKRYE